ncbi:MAG: DUF2807 domain-containing protein [Saprospiraceae bacterium]|nr:DUF2807 domain-containing protein [Saprospiraceae bacterium]
MRKKLSWLMLAIAGIFTINGCFIDVDDDDGFFNCVDGNGPVVTETLAIPGFTGISLQISATVLISQGPVQEVVVEGHGNIIDELELDVNNNIWTIETDRCVRSIGDLKIFITVPDISVLNISGSGDILSENTLVISDIEMNISGSGTIDVEMEADDIDAAISGSGEVFLSGNADELNCRISGSGDLRAFNLQSRVADLNISGSGDAEVRVSDQLDVRISGSGDVFYKGNPTLNVQISGSGQVVNAN